MIRPDGMILRPLARLALALAAGWLCACSGSDSRPREDGVMLSLEEVLARPPARELPGAVKVWAAEKGADLGVYYVLCAAPRVGQAGQARAALRIVLLEGQARLRVGEVVKESGPGAYAVAPPGAAWNLERLGKDPLVFSLLVSPDAVPLADLLRPIP